jgi:hypothetical protein
VGGRGTRHRVGDALLRCGRRSYRVHGAGGASRACRCPAGTACSQVAARRGLVVDRRCRMGESRAAGGPWGDGLGQGDVGRLVGERAQGGGGPGALRCADLHAPHARGGGGVHARGGGRAPCDSSLDLEECALGICSTSAPIFGAIGRVVAARSILRSPRMSQAATSAHPETRREIDGRDGFAYRVGHWGPRRMTAALERSLPHTLRCFGLAQRPLGWPTP